MSEVGAASLVSAYQTIISEGSFEQIHHEIEHLASSDQIWRQSEDYGLSEWRNGVALIRKKFKDK